MGKHTLLILLLFSLILFHGSHASFLKDLRKLIDSTKVSFLFINFPLFENFHFF